MTPSANAAATASTGISSWTFGISSPSITVAVSALERTRTSPTGSPQRSSVCVDLDVGAHAAQHLDEAEPRRVQRQRLDREIGARRDQRADHEERGRRRIAGHLELERLRGTGPHAHDAKPSTSTGTPSAASIRSV